MEMPQAFSHGKVGALQKRSFSALFQFSSCCTLEWECNIRLALEERHSSRAAHAGASQHALPKRISGSLKRVWHPLLQQDKQTKWISQKKPSLGRPTQEAGAAEAEG